MTTKPAKKQNDAPESNVEWISLSPKKIPKEITESDYQGFLEIINIELSPEQVARAVTPPKAYPRQESVLAVHWHPEFLPMDLIERRIDATFPHRKNELIIPTQHNQLTTFGAYTGVEVDCFSRGFNQKVQLLFHFKNERLKNAGVFKGMLSHTFRYRSSQLFEFMDALTRPQEDYLSRAAAETGANEDLVSFVRIYAKKLTSLLEQNDAIVPRETIKNKLIRNFFDTLRPQYGDAIINRAQTFLQAVKRIVKEHFSLDYFYRTSEVLEEARSLGAGVVIPHPEQFWPILLAEYDVDGIEVWNPQSRKYTEFLISVLNRKNRGCVPAKRRLLAFMGDDTHMSEKVRDIRQQDTEKAAREVGVQPAWEDMLIRKALIMAGFDRHSVIREYKSRL